MSIKDSLENFKYCALISSLVSIAIIAIPFYLIVLLGASYASLLGINYVLNAFPTIGLSQFSIEIVHIILFSILLAVILKPSKTNESFDKQTEQWITSNLNVHYRKLDEIGERLDRLEAIKDYLIEINSNVEQINSDKNV